MDLFLDELLRRLATTSVQTALLVALVWSLCRWLRTLPPASQCWLWWLVALQAVIGLCAAPLELALLPAAAPASVALQAAPALLPATAQAALPATALAPALAIAPTAGATGWHWASLLAALWLAGVLLMATRTVFGWRASRRLLRGSQACRDAHLLGALRLAAQAHGLARAPALRLSTAIDSPQLVGPWRPVLLLPAQRLAQIGDDALDMALTHELVHLRRRDLWWGLLPSLAQHLFFFHPLVHLAVREYAIAREVACDAAVVAGHRHCRQHYGQLLLQFGVAPRPRAGVASASPSFVSLKRRLLMLQTTSAFPRLLAMLIVATVGVLGVTPLRLVAMPTGPVAVPTPPTAPAPLDPALQPPLPTPPTAPPAPSAPLPPAPVAPSKPPTPPSPQPAATPSSTPHPAATPRPAPAPAQVTQGRLDLGQGPRNAFVLVDDDHDLVDASLADLREAHAASDSHALWIRRNGQRYLVRDQATLAKFTALYRSSQQLAEQQGTLGDRQGVLGEQQARLGRQIAALSTQVAQAADAQARLVMAHHVDVAAAADAAGAARQAEDAVRRSGVETRAQQAAEQQARLATERAKAALHASGADERIRALAEQQAALGLQQAELSRRQQEASEQARREAERLIEDAIRTGIAAPIGGTAMAAK
jgi:beta-lactamase regulating signal transducer with metallopeptidase domain